MQSVMSCFPERIQEAARKAKEKSKARAASLAQEGAGEPRLLAGPLGESPVTESRAWSYSPLASTQLQKTH